MPQGKYMLSTLRVGDVEVPLTSGKITRGVGAMLWDVEAKGVPQDADAGLSEVLGAVKKDLAVHFTESGGAEHAAHGHLVRGFNLSGGTLTFTFEGQIK
jgi:hypothetical protein